MDFTREAALALFLTVAQACNECNFVERCEGGVRQVCGGIDQVIGRRVRDEPCRPPNGSCVQDGLRAACVSTPPTACGADFTARCDGESLVSCAAGYVSVTECAAVRRPDGSPADLTCRPGADARPQCLPR
jgi:hypothetical protein